MEIMIGVLGLAFVVQVVLSLKAKRVAVRCIPAFVVLALMVASFLVYALSGWTNWAWLGYDPAGMDPIWHCVWNHKIDQNSLLM